MDFRLSDAVLLLSRTPEVLRSLLAGLPDGWLNANEGGETWSPTQVVAHLSMADRTNWLPRTKALRAGEPFPPLDRFAHLNTGEVQGIAALLDEFATIRAASLAGLRALDLSPTDLQRQGQHPEFGPVTLAQLLSTWVVHDQDHLVQISRTLAGNYRGAVGPWAAYLSVLRKRT